MEFYIGDSSNDEYFINRRGISFLVHNHTVNSLFIGDEGIEAEPGLSTNIRIRRYFVNQKGPPYSDCLEDSSIESPIKTKLTEIIFYKLNQTKYNQMYCFNLCFQEFLIQNCSCFDYALPFYNIEHKQCMTESQLNCYSKLLSLFIRNPEIYCKNYCKIIKKK